MQKYIAIYQLLIYYKYVGCFSAPYRDGLPIYFHKNILDSVQS